MTCYDCRNIKPCLFRYHTCMVQEGKVRIVRWINPATAGKPCPAFEPKEEPNA